MRIIAGKFKAKRINSPKTDKTRPTLDRVKEALFSIIDDYIDEGEVLDLFGGTGNLALEAISRGAKFAWINDKESLSISTILSNVKLTNTTEYVKITKKDYAKCLNQIVKEDKLFDVIFLDPPYDSNLAIDTLSYISESEDKVLKKEGIIIYETDKNFLLKLEKNKKSEILKDFKNLQCIDERAYGNVVLMMYKWR